MAYTGANLLGSGTDNNSLQTIALTGFTPPTAGRECAVIVVNEDAAPAGVTDNGGTPNTWTAAFGTAPGVATSSFIQVFRTTIGSVPTTINIDLGATFRRPTNWFLVELVGTPAASPVDQVSAAPGTTTATAMAVAAQGPTAQADEIAIAIWDAMNGSTIALDGALTAVDGGGVSSANGGNGVHVTRVGYQILTSTGTPSYTSTRTGGSKSVEALVTFKAAGAGGQGGPASATVHLTTQATGRKTGQAAASATARFVTAATGTGGVRGMAGAALVRFTTQAAGFKTAIGTHEEASALPPFTTLVTGALDRVRLITAAAGAQLVQRSGPASAALRFVTTATGRKTAKASGTATTRLTPTVAGRKTARGVASALLRLITGATSVTKPDLAPPLTLTLDAYVTTLSLDDNPRTLTIDDNARTLTLDDYVTELTLDA